MGHQISVKQFFILHWELGINNNNSNNKSKKISLD